MTHILAAGGAQVSRSEQRAFVNLSMCVCVPYTIVCMCTVYNLYNLYRIQFVQYVPYTICRCVYVYRTQSTSLLVMNLFVWGGGDQTSQNGRLIFRYLFFEVGVKQYKMIYRTDR